MVNPVDICEVRAGGASFRAWKTVDVERSIDNQITMQATLVVAEVGDFKSWNTLQLKPGDPATVSLAGRQVINGSVAVRQVSYDAGNHNVRIVILSKLQDSVVSSAKPEQQKNVTLKQAANRILSPSGISFSLLGNPKNADKIFKSVITHVGETQLEAVVRLCKMRNIHLMDDKSGNLIGIRHDGSEKSVAELREGRNIINAEMIWRYDTVVDRMQSNGQEPGSNQKSGDAVRNPAAYWTSPTATNMFRNVIFVAEHPGDISDQQMRVNHEGDLNQATMFDLSITVRGWQRSNGNLWLDETHQIMDVYSPMLFPSGKETLGLYRVNCIQADDIGTITRLSFCTKSWLGHGADLMQSGPQGQAAQTDAQPKTEIA
jgi:prophage tail gpP-like protein